MAKPKNKPLQIYLRQDQVNALRRVAERRGESLAELIRQGVDMLLDGLPSEQDPLLEILCLYDSGIQDLAQKHDNYLVDLSQDESTP
jgi:hypothetical protein